MIETRAAGEFKIFRGVRVVVDMKKKTPTDRRSNHDASKHEQPNVVVFVPLGFGERSLRRTGRLLNHCNSNS